jgi:hypothetical protein
MERPGNREAPVSPSLAFVFFVENLIIKAHVS